MPVFVQEQQEPAPIRTVRAGPARQSLFHCPNSCRAASGPEYQHNCDDDGSGLRCSWEVSLWARVSVVHSQLQACLQCSSGSFTKDEVS